MLGYAREELLDARIENVCHPESLKTVLKSIKQLKKQGLAFVDITLRKKDGTDVPTVINATVLPGGDYLATVRDVTKHKRAADALRRSEERFAKVFAASPTGMIITSYPGGRIIDVNDAYLKTFGYAKDEVLGRTTTELGFWSRPEDRGAMIRRLASRGASFNMQTLFRKKTGEEGVALRSTHRIELGGELCILTTLTDITERIRMEREMLRLDRLNLVGETAAGIAHEIRNPMAAARGFIQMLGEKDEWRHYRRYFQLIIDELDRANGIITEFLSLARNKPVSLKRQNLNTIIKALLPLILVDGASHNINVITVLDDIPDLPLDEKEIRQLILNLVRNGLDAMPGGKELTIRTCQKDGDVVLTVQDQGPEITPEILKRMGTPFFTTKEQGTGLGLTTCYSIARRHNAAVAVHTGSGGTTFSVSFKLTDP